jgi:DNA repair exonuclease SbcCD ATPase subunit
MQIQKVTFRNFGSYGNKTLSLDIPSDPSFFLIQGKNGHGKSTLSDVIKFAIFGKLENKKLKDMANRLNKNAYVKLEMMTRKGKVEIERGIEPGFFKLSVNGTEIDKAGKRSVQEYLEEEVLEMPFYVFSNTLSLSINDFKSFLRMSSFDKKAIIDKIFGLQILNQMREILKHQTKKLKENVDSLTTSINAFTKSLEASQREFEDLENKIKESSSEKKTSLLKSRDLYIESSSKYEDNLKKIASKIEKVQDARKTINESISGDRQLLISVQEKIHLYDNSQCPTCQTSLVTDFHQDLKKEYLQSYEDAMKRYTDKEEKLKTLNENYRKLDTLRTEQRNSMTTSQVNLSHINNQLKELGEEVDDHQTASIKNMIDDFSGKIQDTREEQIKNQKAIAFYGLAEEILGEKGVKQMAIKTILPPLNTEIAKIVKTLGVEHRIVFNEDFDAKITHFGLDVSVDTLSTGELKKVDFAVLLAVIRMMKMKYPYMNMLFLDEIFSSIDGDGQYHILKILREIVKEYNMNIFVISHYPLSYTEFDYTIEITKNNGFSTFEILQTE